MTGVVDRQVTEDVPLEGGAAGDPPGAALRVPLRGPSDDAPAGAALLSDVLLRVPLAHGRPGLQLSPAGGHGPGHGRVDGFGRPLRGSARRQPRRRRGGLPAALGPSGRDPRRVPALRFTKRPLRDRSMGGDADLRHLPDGGALERSSGSAGVPTSSSTRWSRRPRTSCCSASPVGPPAAPGAASPRASGSSPLRWSGTRRSGRSGTRLRCGSRPWLSGPWRTAWPRSGEVGRS